MVGFLYLISCDECSDSSVCAFNILVRRRFPGGLGAGIREESLFADVKTEALKA